jgi:hypothetical protein
VSTYYNVIGGKQMAKIISAVRIRPDRAEKLRDKSVDLMIESKNRVTEADIINFLIDEFTERIKIDKDGFFIADEID